MNDTSAVPAQSLRWLGLYLAAALAYIATEPLRPYPLHYLVKALPVLLLMMVAVKGMTGRLRSTVLAALLFSAAGDVALALSFPHQFVVGLALFLIAQVLYLTVFVRLRCAEHVGIKVGMSAGIGCYAALMAGLVVPDDAVMRMAVICYLIVISAMAISAVWAWRTSLLHVGGAVAFVLSDSVIAWNSFREPVPCSSLLVMSTYYLAQVLLVYGIVRRTDKSASGRGAGLI